MRPDDDDEADAFGGPPPDPSLRAWRHPSEIASAAAAANRQPPSRASSSRAIVPTIAAVVGVGLIATAVVGIVAITGSFDPMSETSRFEIEAAGRATTSSGRTLLTTALATSLAPPSSTTAPPSSESSATTSSTPFDVAPGATGDSETAQDWSAGLDPSLTAWDGVFTSKGGSAARLADFMVVNEVVFTSAAAIEDGRDLGLVVDGRWITATPVLIDPSDDVAMLEVSAEDLSYLLVESESVWSTTDDYQPPTPGTMISITNLSLAQAKAAGGSVLASAERAMVSNGRPVYGSVVTTAHRPAGSSGGAMVDQDGNLVGLIIDSDGVLTAAIPVDRLMSIKDSYERWGVAATEWLGIEGSFRTTRGAILTSVTEGGPADLAGLQAGDIIMAIDGTALIDWAHLVYLIRQSGAGSTIEISVDRHGYENTMVATIGSLSDRPDPTLALAPTQDD